MNLMERVVLQWLEIKKGLKRFLRFPGYPEWKYLLGLSLTLAKYRITITPLLYYRIILRHITTEFFQLGFKLILGQAF